MELFAAPNLKQWINQGSRGARAAWPASSSAKAAEGLAYFHSQGWIHRDIKPDNFLMNPKGDVKLIDFALAVRRKGGLARLFAGKTKVQGTRSYMSPEQIRGQPLDERADIYSFGCMVYEAARRQAAVHGQQHQRPAEQASALADSAAARRRTAT